ncbi:YqaE/Pmp3 family membrane protein [Burkholderia pseudomallei]|uniref:YqaE/Pmp3 family membrane protein n=1 Tax=Burkholderia pseudomallei TaxID=28450 RepID=UPI0009771534
MRIAIAVVFPWLTFLTIRRPVAGVICLALQLSIVGWLPATLWAVSVLRRR